MILRAAKRPVIVLANKIDDPRRDSESAVFHRLGLGEPVAAVGAARPRHRRPARRDRRRACPARARSRSATEAIRVAILGRPNVGKSSLLNRLVGRERVIVSEVPGTTRDAIDTVLQRGETTFVLVDTAGSAQAAQAAAGDRVLLRAAGAPGGRAGRRRARAVRCVRGDRRAGPRRRRHRAQGGLLDARGALEVGCHGARDRRGAGASGAPASPAAAGDRRLGEVGARHRPPARQGRGAVREAQRPDHDRRAEPRARRAQGGAARGPRASGEGG